MVAETGIMQLLAIKIAEFSKGQKRLYLMMFGAMMFLISSYLNNITEVMMILPIVFVLLKTLEVDRKYVCVFFAAILALSNTGGAASPVGGFPAIVIMTSGITSFIGYLTHAFPLFALTSIVLIVVWGMYAKKEDDDGAIRNLAVNNLKSQHKNIEIHVDVLKWLGVDFVGMFLAWSLVSQEILPPEIIAVLGYAVAMIICSTKKIRMTQMMDFKSVLTIASFLFFAQVISQTGLLNTVAAYLQSNIGNPKLLVMAIMVITSLVSGIFSAGPAAAAMMPIIVEICSGSLGGTVRLDCCRIRGRYMQREQSFYVECNCWFYSFRQSECSRHRREQWGKSSLGCWAVSEIWVCKLCNSVIDCSYDNCYSPVAYWKTIGREERIIVLIY